MIATWYLIWKTQGYWAFMVVNAGLWTYLFFHVGLPMLAWLQISFLAMSVYGAVQWALVRLDIGFRLDRRSDVAGSVLAAGVFAYSVYAYWGMPGYTGTVWWALELGSVLTAIAAIWMDAFRYRLNWVSWTVSNCLSAPLFLHGRLWGPLLTIPIYQAFNVLGWIRWTREQRWTGRRSVRMRRGLVFGKFMPLHRGHQLLIDRALAQTDDVTIVVYDSEPPGAYPPMPLEKRLGWLERLYPQAEAIVPVADPLRDEPDADDPRHAALYAETVRFLGRFDMVFTSEPSYERFARELGARHVVVDAARELVPISGTRIRENVFEHRGWLDPDVYASLIRKVVLVGTESSGQDDARPRAGRAASGRCGRTSTAASSGSSRGSRARSRTT